MEREKLDEGRKTFQEDKEKYDKFKMDLQAKSAKTEEEVGKVQKEIAKFQNKINDLKKDEAQLISEDSKYQEELQGHKYNKKFLDLLAIGAKIKMPVSQRARKARKMRMTPSHEEFQPVDGGSRQAKQHGDATFMTQITNPGAKKSLPPRTRSKDFVEDDDRAHQQSSLTGGKTEEGDEQVSD